MTARRELRVAVLLCLLGSALVLLAVARPWVSFVDPGSLTISALRREVTGSTVVPGARALGYVGLAGVLALAATKRWGRTVVGVLVLGAGLGVAVTVVAAWSDGLASRAVAATSTCAPACDGSGRPSAEQPSVQQTWPVLTLLGGVLLASSGGLVAVRGRRWAALSASYEQPAAPKPVEGDKGVWDALDRGDDPTET